MAPDAVNILAAFLGGLASFLLPCMLAMVPIFVAHLAGITLTSLDDLGQKRYKFPIFFHTLSFVLGFTAVFVVLGASIGLLTESVSGAQLWVTRVGGVVIILFGLISLGLIKNPFLAVSRLEGLVPKRQLGYLGSVLIGAGIGIGWVPCTGPILSSILVLAGAEGSVGKGSLLLLVYSMGMMLPFLGFSLFTAWGTRFIRGKRRWLRYSNYVAGVLLIALGIVVFTDNLREILGYFSFPTLSGA